MELLLNLVWSIISLATIGLWLREHARLPNLRQKHHGLVRGLIVLICALAVLFPAISLTDDLHSEVVLMEEWNSSRRFLKNDVQLEHSSNLLNWHACCLNFGHAESLSPHFQAMSWVLPAGVPPRLETFLDCPACRAPPISTSFFS